MGRRLLPLLLALALAAPAAGSESRRPAEAIAPIRDLLARRAAAVARRDLPAFMESVDPAQPAFREAQARRFTWMGALSLNDYSLELDPEDGELTRRQDRERYGVPVVVAPVEERYRIEGYGDDPVLSTAFLTFVLRDGRWRIAADADVEDLGLTSSRELWDFGSVQVARSEHFMVLAHPDEARFAPEILRLAEEALPGVDEIWRRPWSKRVPILVPSSREELEELLDTPLDVSKFVAFALFSIDRDEGVRWQGSRIILNRANFLARTAATRRVILVHELVHVATTEARGAFTAGFVEEGLAELAGAGTGGTGLLDAQVRRGRFDAMLPEDLDFSSGSQAEIVLAYQEAASAIGYMRDRFGLEGVAGFYEAYGSARIEPGTVRYHLDRSFRQALGISLEQFEREWASNVKATRG